MGNLPWLLQQFHAHDVKAGHRLLDVVDMHMYPQGGDGNDDVSDKIELLRNRDTRSLWDPSYVDESWIKAPIAFVPRLKSMIATYYPGTKIGITEYNWGAEKSISGALAQADLLGIFGREGVFLATRWIAPDAATPGFKAMQMYRNYNGQGGAFGSVGVSDSSSSSPRRPGVVGRAPQARRSHDGDGAEQGVARSGASDHPAGSPASALRNWREPTRSPTQTQSSHSPAYRRPATGDRRCVCRYPAGTKHNALRHPACGQVSESPAAPKSNGGSWPSYRRSTGLTLLRYATRRLVES